MSIDELCYNVIGSAMAVHRQHKHKYRIYRSPNPVDPVNPV